RPRGHARALPWGAITHRSGTLRSPAARAPDGPVRRRFQASGAVAVRELIPSEAPATAEAVGLTQNATVVLRAAASAAHLRRPLALRLPRAHPVRLWRALRAARARRRRADPPRRQRADDPRRRCWRGHGGRPRSAAPARDGPARLAPLRAGSSPRGAPEARGVRRARAGGARR